LRVFENGYVWTGVNFLAEDTACRQQKARCKNNGNAGKWPKRRKRNSEDAPTSEFVVRTVAHGHIAGSFTSAEPDFAGFLGRVLNRAETGLAMGTIAKRLTSTLTAGAPPVFLAGLHFDATRRFLRDNRC